MDIELSANTFWRRLARPRRSLVARYTLLSIVVMSVALIALAVLYEQLAKDLLNRLTGERLDAQAVSTANRLSSFLDDRFYQLSALSNHPSMPDFIADQAHPAGDVDALLKLESELPFLYGVLFFDEHERLLKVMPGQAASGAPYWGREGWSLDGLARQRVGDVEVIGPALPQAGRSGWLLIRKTIRSGRLDHRVSIGLHLRLASITELLVSAGLNGIVTPLLRVPGGAFIDATGRQVEAPRDVREGPMILPGWQVVFSVQPGAVLKPLDDARWWLYLAAVGFIGFILIVFFTLSRQLRSRVGSLVEGAHQLSSGDLGYRLPEQPHNDEIGRVTRAFNVMAGRLADVMERTVRAENLAVLGTFATGVAHEVRNPLATMKTTVQALLRREQEAERRLLLSDLCQEIDRLSHVTSDLLEYGRPHPAIAQVVDLPGLLARTTRLLAPEAEAKGVNVSATCQAGVQLWVDPDQAQQILLNLCLNAVEASAPGQCVVISGLAWGERVGVTVVDQGCGIPEAALQQVRQPFFTLKARGTGLGLSICQQLLEANASRMELASTPGVGTVVSVDFPAPAATYLK
ncbi:MULTISPECIES: HAMP domain-containing sensor histidine kinase [Pseudomonas]|uniref:Two-component system sensor histidine kinase AtoS n=1 Tax=Pseudomonas hunanensis TaxID=1247546 RepID=A0ACC6JYZ5_9PSED|nr:MULTISPECIES: HAMP domain-containing sensor histidine kinase [Pseudomonas]MBP2262183.1 two-component system sensor histidine kinase AtoS [Pseudomonas sp. BP8]MDR6711393.1 two-component system sensor histidine kinase AtoS [Pseudomonas hunanensis]HDS1733109.1 HAMP domain-containing protein [Pseudomonas putida]